MHTQTVLYLSSLVTITDYQCRMSIHQQGAEEVSASHQVVFVRTGAFMRMLDKESALADPAHVLFFTQGQPYRVAHPIAGGDRCTVLEFSLPTLLEVVGRHWPHSAAGPHKPFPRSQGLNTARSALLHCALLARLRRPEGSRMAVEELSLQLLDEALRTCALPDQERHHAGCPPARAHRELAEATKVVLAEHYRDPPPLSQIAQSLGATPFHLCRVFGRAVGIPMRRYLHRVRLRLALERLATGEGHRDLTGLALDLGYADHSHFTNAFRREFGLPPSALACHARHTIGTLRKNVQAWRLPPA